MEEDKHWIYNASRNGHTVKTVTDSYASHTFIAHEVAKKFRLLIKNVPEVEVELRDSSNTSVIGKVTAILNL